MTKAFVGVRLRRLREERGMNQLSVARALEISSSYYNQLEKNQRPLTVPLLVRLTGLFGVDAQFFSEEDEAKLMTDLREALAAGAPEIPISHAELRALASEMPAVARALCSIQRRQREATEQGAALAARLGDAQHAVLSGLPPMPYEEVRDLFAQHHNYFDALDQLAERLAETLAVLSRDPAQALETHLRDRHGVRVIVDRGDHARAPLRHYDPVHKTLQLWARLEPRQRAFQLATQLALLEAAGPIDKLIADASALGTEARALARIGFASYFAGALIMPYREFLRAAEALQYDVGLLGQRFDAGFETVCHRLSTLQRPGAPGVPFFFVRVDRAGNISKRQSATDFHFSRVGGTCPLWNVYEAFAASGRMLTQLAQMPDGRTYLWIARTVSREHAGFGTPTKTFAIGLGCDLRHAHRLVYSRGLDLTDPAARTPIGSGCKVCERASCPQRAFPPIGKSVAVDVNESRFEPYSVK
ncbi:MAG TPA: short-chain fatty acyl-CoA regulator family protein [Polyangiales bacterium]|nr:short-chain fatty acyl-CoA regulator family protein [Polyangiales bacterium]